MLRRLALIPILLAGVNFLAFAYAHVAQRVQASMNPYGAPPEDPRSILSLYAAYIAGVLRGDLGTLPPPTNLPVEVVVGRATVATLGLLGMAFVLSIAAGLLLGLLAVRTRPPRIAPWLLPIAAVAGSAPAFFIAAICLALLTRLAINQPAGATPPLPLQGFGWDRHMILPLIALIPRPAAQLAQLVAALLVEELSQQHVVAAAARGVGWQTIRRRHAFRNILAPVIAAAAGTLRLLAGEVVLVEWLFGWPGLGRLLALTLLPPSIATVGGLRGARPEYLDPELLALTVTVFAAIFLAVDLIAAVASRAADPRLREPELQAAA